MKLIFAVLYVTMTGLNGSCLHFIFAVFLHQSTAVIPIFRFWKQMATVLKFYFRFRFWLSACGSASTYKFLSELDDSLRSCDVILIFQDGRQARTSTFGFSIWSWLTLKKIKKTMCTPNFDKIFQPTAEILLLSASGNKPPPYWNSTSGFHFDDIIVIGMWFCVAAC